MAKKKETKEENPMYRKMCENSNDCTCERKSKKIEDMEITSCSQCFHIFEWQKIVVDKKSEAPESKVDKKPEETKATEKVKEPVNEKVESKSDDETASNAKEMQEAFAEVDNITADIDNMTGSKKKEAAPEKEVEVDDLDPFADREPEEVKTVEGTFVIKDCKIKSATTVRMVCEGSKDKRWALDIESEAEKVAKIGKNPGALIDKKIKVEYMGFDNEGRPNNPKYLAIIAK